MFSVQILKADNIVKISRMKISTSINFMLLHLKLFFGKTTVLTV